MVRGDQQRNGSISVASMLDVSYPYGRSAGESKHANARLIAAAPELLDALRSMLAQFNFNTITGIVHDESAVIVKAREAVAKATGGE